MDSKEFNGTIDEYIRKIRCEISEAFNNEDVDANKISDAFLELGDEIKQLASRMEYDEITG